MNVATETGVCVHCGTPFRPTLHRPDFCCAGCQFVHGLIAENGFGQFYDLQEGGVAPVQSTVFQRRDYSWLEELGRDGAGKLTLDVQGLSCIGCAWLIERLFLRKPGALAIHVDPALGQLEFQWQPGVFDPVAFGRELQSFGYLVGPPGQSAGGSGRALNLRLGICAALAMNTMLFTLPHYLGMEGTFPFAPLFARLTLIFGTLSFFIGGSYFFIRSWHSLRQRVLHMDLPISLGLVAAYAGSVFAWFQEAQGFVYFDFVATFTFLMLAGRWLQQKVVARNRSQLLAAHAAPPPVRSTSGERITAKQIAIGDLFVVEPGQVVPVLARLRSESALLGMEWISGESEAVTSVRGSLVAAGALNCGSTAIEMEAREWWADSLLARLLEIKPPGQTRDPALERFLRRYIVMVLGLAFAGSCGWWVATGELLPALQVGISVLVVSCPCASGIALPLCRDFAASRLRRMGVFVRDGEIWSRLARVRKVIFDKTGTLTLETISLLNPEALQTLREKERALLLAMVNDSLHPVSRSLREQLLADRVEPEAIGEVVETIGFGLETVHRGFIWRLGRPAWATTERGRQESSNADSVLSCDGQPVVSFQFGEAARDGAREEVAALRARGLEVFILSGDRREKVRAMADQLRLARSQCLAELSPVEKAEQVRAWDAQDTLYIGDGANDSLAFEAASIRGTPAVDRGLLEQKADFYFLGRGLSGVRSLLCLGATQRRAARRVVAFAIAYNAVAIALCLGGLMSPLLAAILMPASSLVSLGLVLAVFRRERVEVPGMGNRGR